MRKQIVKIAPLQAAKVAAVFYFLLSLIPALGMTVAMAFSKNPSSPQRFLLLLMPIFYVGAGFVFTLISAAIYNAIAGSIGGIEVEVANATDA
jgi:hypothetical protein